MLSCLGHCWNGLYRGEQSGRAFQTNLLKAHSRCSSDDNIWSRHRSQCPSELIVDCSLGQKLSAHPKQSHPNVIWCCTEKFHASYRSGQQMIYSGFGLRAVRGKGERMAERNRRAPPLPCRRQKSTAQAVTT